MNDVFEDFCKQAGAKPDSTPAPARHRILVVEDDQALRQRNATILVHSGYTVDIAEDGAAAREALQANHYDLVITDNNMPRLTGTELVKELRAAGIRLPVIMATGTVPAQNLAINPWLESVSTLAKPYASNKLLETVREVLGVGFAKTRPAREEVKHTEPATLTVERYTVNRQREWDAFVRKAKNATFLFYRDYMDYHRDRFTDHSLMVFRGQVLVALLPANLNCHNALVSHEGLTYGGLVVERESTLREVLASFHAVLDFLRKREITQLIYKRIPSFYNNFPDDDVAYALFLLDARLYRRDCSTTVLQADRLPLRTNHKRLIKKAVRAGVRVVQETSFRPFWEEVLAPQLAHRYGVKPVHTLEEITLLASRFPDNIKQYSVYWGDEIVAGTTIYETPTVAHVQYCAVTETGRQLGAQAYDFNSLIERYQSKRFFDFGISNEEEGRSLNQGLLDWKEGFGARCFAHDFYEIATANCSKLESVL